MEIFGKIIFAKPLQLFPIYGIIIAQTIFQKTENLRQQNTADKFLLQEQSACFAFFPQNKSHFHAHNASYTHNSDKFALHPQAPYAPHSLRFQISQFDRKADDGGIL